MFLVRHDRDNRSGTVFKIDPSAVPSCSNIARGGRTTVQPMLDILLRRVWPVQQ